MAEGFIDRFRSICGGSRVLSLLTGVNIAVGVTSWIIIMIMGLLQAGVPPLSGWMALPSDVVTFLHRPWTLLTYMVTHFSLLHLLFNVIWLYWFGRIMLLAVSERSLFICYVAGGLAGGIAYIVSSLCGAAAGDYLCGASASVLAIMCAVAFIMPGYELNLFLLGRVRLKWFAMACVLITLLGTAGSVAGSIAHLGGIAFGAVYGWRLHHAGAEPFGWLKTVTRRTANIFNRGTRHKDAEAMVRAAHGRLSDHERLDELLDKIRVSGYASLTDRERSELDAISSRLR